MNKGENDYLKEYARLYTAFTPRKSEVLPKWIEFALRFKKRRGLLVDVGCGPAEFYPLAKKFGYTYLGVDSNPYMVTRAKREKTRADIRLGNANELPIPDGEAQIILMNMLVHSVGSIREFSSIIAEANRALNDQGLLVITTLSEQKTAKLLSETRQKVNTKPAPIKFEGKFPKGNLLMDAYHWSRRSIIKLLDSAGFDVMPIHLISVGSLPNNQTYDMLWGFKSS
jgi:SAM-dependent methyltransferase